MIIKSHFCILFLLLFCVSSTQGQISINNTSLPAHEHQATHQDSAYHCAMCERHLFDADEVTIVDEEELHYHGIGTDDKITPFHCAGCSDHLGYHNHEDGTYKLISSHVGQDDEDPTIFRCLSCQMSIFNKQSLTNSDDSFHYFKAPIDEKRIVLDERNKFYKAQAQTPHVRCRGCNGLIGEVSPNGSGGFGVRVNVNAVKKKKKF